MFKESIHYQRNDTKVWVIVSGPAQLVTLSHPQSIKEVQSSKSWACPCQMQVWLWLTNLWINNQKVIGVSLPFTAAWEIISTRNMFMSMVKSNLFAEFLSRFNLDYNVFGWVFSETLRSSPSRNGAISLKSVQKHLVMVRNTFSNFETFFV